MTPSASTVSAGSPVTPAPAPVTAAPKGTSLPAGLPERARVSWRARIDEPALRRAGRRWTLWTLSQTVPFLAAAVLLVVVKPILAPIALVLVIHVWALSALYAHRGAAVLRTRRVSEPGPESRALLMLGDLTSEENRRLHADTGLVLAPGRFGTWVVGEAGALLVRPGGHRVNCYCIRVPDTSLPHGDRIAHLLLALRCDEADFTTIANLAFSGARRRVRRRLAPEQRAAVDAAVQAARRSRRGGPSESGGQGAG
jgi:hypothetical protein